MMVSVSAGIAFETKGGITSASSRHAPLAALAPRAAYAHSVRADTGRGATAPPLRAAQLLRRYAACRKSRDWRSPNE